MKKLSIAARAGIVLSLSFNAVALSAGTAHAYLPPAPPVRSVAEQPLPVPDDDAASPKPYTLRFYNLHTDESLTVTRRDGDPLNQKINWFLRDYRRSESTHMDPELLDHLGEIQAAIHRRHPAMTVRFNVVSGYRSPATNDSLIKAGGAQATHSLHMQGKAMDIRVTGIGTRELRDIVTCLGLGGVGYYESDRFVHVDTGRIRYWPSHAYLASLKCNTAPKSPVVATGKIKAHSRS